MDVRLTRMDQRRFDSWYPTLVDRYADHMIASGTMPEVEARERATTQCASLLPTGRATLEHFLYVAHDPQDSDAGEIGNLWLWIHETSVGRSAFIYDIEVSETQRGQGYGRALLAAAERECRRQGAHEVSLNVFGSNHVARRMYETSGFEVTAVNMRKPLDPLLSGGRQTDLGELDGLDVPPG
ncbi:MAG: GNAT family N-acetyltransferase [Nocardioidaceae bacterium]